MQELETVATVDVASQQHETASASAVESDPFAVNLLLLILLGTAFTGWMLHYTDWFPAFGGLLALGGLFSWLAFVSRCLPEARLKALQDRLDQRFFSRRTWRRRLLLLAVVLAALGSFVGSVEIRSLGDPSDRLLWTSDGADALPIRLAPGAVVRTVAWTTIWRPKQVHVRVSGYPPVVVPVRPWHRITRDVPSFFRLVPVVLLQPSEDLMLQANSHLTVLVNVRGVDYSQPFDGHAIWVGCDTGVEVPEAVIDIWRSRRDDAYLPFWSHPASATRSAVALSAGEPIDVWLLNANGAAYGARKRIIVRQPAAPADFPQLEVFP